MSLHYKSNLYNEGNGNAHKYVYELLSITSIICVRESTQPEYVRPICEFIVVLSKGVVVFT